MDSKVTLSFNKDVIEKAKQYAEEKNISLSRLIEFLLKNVTSSSFQSLEDFPIAKWVQQVSEGEAEYHTKKRSRKSVKNEFYKSRK